MGKESQRGADLRYDLEITLEEAATGRSADLKFPRLTGCVQCDGGGSSPSGRPCRACGGKGTLTKDSKISLKIPPGVETGSRLRVAGQGDAGVGGANAGDLYVVIHVAEHELFERQGVNVYGQVYATYEERVRGSEVEAPTLIDGPQRLKLPARTKVGTVFRIRGMGMPTLNGGNRGDLYLSVAEADFDSDREPVIVERPEAKPTLRVFLCHSSGDKPAVRDLYGRLRADGLKPWLDEEDLLPGQLWEKEIPKAVRDCDVVIICLSQSSVTKRGYLQKEIRYALDVAGEMPEGTIFLIPVKLEECEIPEHLRGLQWVNLFEERGYDKLMSALRSRM